MRAVKFKKLVVSSLSCVLREMLAMRTVHGLEREKIRRGVALYHHRLCLRTHQSNEVELVIERAPQEQQMLQTQRRGTTEERERRHALQRRAARQTSLFFPPLLSLWIKQILY